MQLLRRKSATISSEAESLIMKSTRKSSNLSISIFVSTVFLFGLFLYNEDLKSIADFPFSRSRAREIQEGKSGKPTAGQSSVQIDNHSDNRKAIEKDEDVKGDAAAAGVAVSEKMQEKEEDSDGSGDKTAAGVSVSEKKREKEGGSGGIGDNTAAAGDAVSEKMQEKGGGDSDHKDVVDLRSIVAKDRKNEEEDGDDEEEEAVELPPEECDLFDGEWVFDNVTHPLYREEECGFLTAQVTCMRNGRRDSLYQNWRWQPRHCNLPK